jgi:hypothetical protein
MDLLSTALPALGDAFLLIFHPQQIMFLMLGVLLGLSVGVFPGLGGIAGLSLVLPFMYGMEPVSGLALMVGLVAVIPTSDTFASVLMGIPGSSASQATVLDGFPLAKKGEAARALAAAFASSLFGGLFGAVILTFFILIARPLVLAFGLPEMLMITILGLSMVAILAGRLPLKGVAAAGLGLMVGTIGEAAAGGSLRMSTYDVPYLIDGLKLVIVGLGIFAIPEIVALLRDDRAISRSGGLGAGWLAGVRDWWADLFLSIRCSIIGVIVGVIPGLGGSVVDWIAYGHTVQTSKDKSRFGSGDIRGVIGPESSNNAKEGGGLVPTLIFGIPGTVHADFVRGLSVRTIPGRSGRAVCYWAPRDFPAAVRLVAPGFPDRLRAFTPVRKFQQHGPSGCQREVPAGPGGRVQLYRFANRAGGHRHDYRVDRHRRSAGQANLARRQCPHWPKTRAPYLPSGSDGVFDGRVGQRHVDQNVERQDISGNYFIYFDYLLPGASDPDDARARDRWHICRSRGG